jgi:AraC family transcriptional regulator
MSLIGRALWFINAHTGEELSLETIADAVGVSRHHLAHAFGEATGRSVISYVRGLRLSAAARSLAAGAPDILQVALEAGYGSHEAFSRAFRDQFGLTPEQVRGQRQLGNLTLVEPIAMSQPNTVVLNPPTIEAGKAMLIAGLNASYTFDTMSGLPAQWEKFVPHLGHVPGQIGQVAYGVVTKQSESGFDYLCGVEVKELDGLPRDLDSVRIPVQRYAVFRQKDHISQIRNVMSEIWNSWLPSSGYQTADGPRLERYGPDFDGRTGQGGFQIWWPVKD